MYIRIRCHFGSMLTLSQQWRPSLFPSLRPLFSLFYFIVGFSPMACSMALFRRVDTDRYMCYSSALHSILFTNCNGQLTNWELCALGRSGFGRRRKRDAFPFVFQNWHHSCLMHSCCPFPLFTLYVGWGGGPSARDKLSFTTITSLS